MPVREIVLRGSVVWFLFAKPRHILRRDINFRSARLHFVVLVADAASNHAGHYTTIGDA